MSDVSIWQRIGRTMTRWINTLFNTSATMGLAVEKWSTLTRREKTHVLRAYYNSNDLYLAVKTALEERAVVKSELLPLRNPTGQVVEFHVTHLWPGALPDAIPIESDSTFIEAQQAAIANIFKWGNWGTKKQLAARILARDGNLFLKAVQNDAGDRVYPQIIDVMDVVDFDLDERDVIVWIRIDVETTTRIGTKTKTVMHTEVWSKGDEDNLGTYQKWEHDKEWGIELEKLGTPDEELTLVDEWGIDWVPFVYAKFKDIGEKWGHAAIEDALDIVDEANRMATRLHRQLFTVNDVTWALEANMVDATGRPVPAPKILDADGNEVLEVGGIRFVRLPGNSKLVPLVPNVNFSASLAALESHLVGMERQLPEMAYGRLRDQSDVSGEAIRGKLKDAVARVEEARGNVETALVRMLQMCLTIGQNAGLEGFETNIIGVYDDDDFEFTIGEREVIPTSDQEKAQAYTALAPGSPLPEPVAMKLAGYDQVDIDEATALLDQKREQQEQAFSNSVLAGIDRLNRERETAGGETEDDPATELPPGAE